MSSKGHDSFSSAFHLMLEAEENGNLNKMLEAIEFYKQAIADSTNDWAHGLLAHCYNTVGFVHLQQDKPDNKAQYDKYIALSMEQVDLALAINEKNLPALIVKVHIQADAILIRAIHQQAMLDQTDWRPNKLNQVENDMRTAEMIRVLVHRYRQLLDAFSFHLKELVLHVPMMDFVNHQLMVLAKYLWENSLITTGPLSELYRLVSSVDLDKDVSWEGVPHKVVKPAREKMLKEMNLARSNWIALRSE